MHCRITARLAPVFAAALCLLSSPSSANPGQRIVGGDPILIDSAPSMVALISTQTLLNTGSVAQAQFCGGTLIDPSWVLTAAHCVVFDEETVLPDDLKIVANSHDLNNIATDPVDVARIIVHESYSDFSNENDIALLQLSRPAITSGQAALINTMAVPINERLVAAGWGARQFNLDEGSFDFATTLHAVEVLALPAAQCNTLPAYAGAVSDTMLCAGFRAGGFDTCQGDSGGPLYRQIEDGSLVVAGVTSWGDGCALEERPGVYTDVASYEDWLRTNMTVTIDGPVIAQTQPEETTDGGASDSAFTGLSVTSNPEDGTTVIVLPALAGLQGSAGSAGGWLMMVLLSFVGLRARKAHY